MGLLVAFIFNGLSLKQLKTKFLEVESSTFQFEFDRDCSSAQHFLDFLYHFCIFILYYFESFYNITLEKAIILSERQ